MADVLIAFLLFFGVVCAGTAFVWGLAYGAAWLVDLTIDGVDPE